MMARPAVEKVLVLWRVRAMTVGSVGHLCYAATLTLRLEHHSDRQSSMLPLFVMNNRYRDFRRLERLQTRQVDVTSSQQVGRSNSIPVVDLKAEVGADA